MSVEENTAYSKRLHYAGVIMWPSFLAACIATMVFFAMFDPVELGHITTWDIELNRQLGYTLGFFGFWLLTLLSSTFTLILILPGNQDGDDKSSDKTAELRND